ncbi:alkaline phosphatase family protein [Lacimicrobium alkaliphilum]|uniref:Phosphoglyceromutase n=1 Tax=Lacimicrobium alkaliphilum TaxID=1526571 RepID=A0ABQ1R7P2_9ALTE|nr:alkaline phosphatase family protein [Lacimicrobium alkaliphilum]GGD59138.1 hypothetical protein GCM10011357_13030 [Lacimicrobium alkaliphilum]
MFRILFLSVLLFCCGIARGAHNVLLVTIDGVRWQEVFRGADPDLISHNKFVRDPDTLKAAFWDDNSHRRRQLLMPFLWNSLAKQGVLAGNRDINSDMRVANRYYFSYPGYSELLTGIVDKAVNSNDPVPNPHVSFLEWLQHRPGFEARPALFGSWDIFPYIVNQQRSQLHVNAGFQPAHGYPLSASMLMLNELQKQIPSPWHNVRLDAFTYRFSKDYLLHVKPRVMMIALGEPDDFAHNGKYDKYLHGIRRADAYIADLWQTIQSTAGYKNNTVLLITTDHGRGDTAADWQHHSSALALKGNKEAMQSFPNGIVGSEYVWLAAMGPGIANRGEIEHQTPLYLAQLSSTVVTLLGEDPKHFNPDSAPAIKEILK